MTQLGVMASHCESEHCSESHKTCMLLLLPPPFPIPHPPPPKRIFSIHDLRFAALIMNNAVENI